MNIYSRLLTLFQFIFLMVLMLSGPVVDVPFVAGLVMLAGVSLGLWALLVMGWENFSPFPLPRKNSKAVYSGPYRLIRHPMYTSLLMIFLPMMFVSTTSLRLAAFGGLLVVLVLKIRIEESRLSAMHPGYAAYRRKTWRLIPWIV
jgi:protein-S-isoprenylcysteine O-methyltransferase Ste14